MTGEKKPLRFLIFVKVKWFNICLMVIGIRCIWCAFLPRPDQGISHLENLTKKTKCRIVPQVHLPAVTCPCQNHHSLLQGKKKENKDDQGSLFHKIQYSGLCSVNFVDWLMWARGLFRNWFISSNGDLSMVTLLLTASSILFNFYLSFNIQSKCQFLLGITYKLLLWTKHNKSLLDEWITVKLIF